MPPDALAAWLDEKLDNARLRAQIVDLEAEIASQVPMRPVGYYWRRMVGFGRADGGFDFTNWHFAATYEEIPKDHSGIQVQTLWAEIPMLDWLTVPFLWHWVPVGIFGAFCCWFGAGPR